MGCQIYIPGTILARIKFFSFDSVTFSYGVFYLYNCLSPSIKLNNYHSLMKGRGVTRIEKVQTRGDKFGHFVIT